MPSTPRPDDAGQPRPMTALRLRELIVLALREHPDIAAARPAGSMHDDRHAVDVDDHHGLTWRVHVLATPRRAGGAR
jgi:hypothetical protein